MTEGLSKPTDNPIPSPPSGVEGARPNEWVCPKCQYEHNSIYSIRCLKCERWKDGFEEDRAGPELESAIKEIYAYRPERDLSPAPKAGVEVEREEFEAWAKTRGWMCTRSHPDGDYDAAMLDEAWAGWQAARATRREK